MAAKKGRGATINVALLPDVARDLCTVLRKFSEQRMEKLLVGEHKQADRLLALNLLRREIEDDLEEV